MPNSSPSKELSKTYRNLWVFGDSYSTPTVCVEPSESFWAKVGKALGVEKIYNCSWPGNSIDSVIHTLISQSDQYDWSADFFLIGIPPLTRLTAVSGDSTKSYHRFVFDSAIQQIDRQMMLCHHGLENVSILNKPNLIDFYDPTWNEIQACRWIFLLNQWLDVQGTNYLIINLSKDFQDDQPATGEFLLQKCFSHPKNILKGKTYWGINYGVNQPADFDQFGWAGHHGPIGNKNFFENSLLPKLKECEFI